MFVKQIYLHKNNVCFFKINIRGCDLLFLVLNKITHALACHIVDIAVKCQALPKYLLELKKAHSCWEANRPEKEVDKPSA